MTITQINTKSLTVDEIRDHIINTHNIDRDTLFNIKGKSNLVNFLLSLEKVATSTNGPTDEELEATMGMKDEDIAEFQISFDEEKTGKDGKEIPDKSDPEWTEYVLSQLTDKEKDKEYPKADGLRRLVEKLISPISRIETRVIQPPQKDNFMTSTVKTTIFLENGQVYDACTDVQKEHLTHPFDKHISAIAETRAEGRAYRKILRLQNIVTQEEIVSDTNLDDSKMTKTQISFLDILCNNTRLNINVQKIFDYVFKDKKLDDIKKYSNTDVALVCAMLSEYQEDMTKIPNDIRGFTPNWKD